MFWCLDLSDQLFFTWMQGKNQCRVSWDPGVLYASADLPQQASYESTIVVVMIRIGYGHRPMKFAARAAHCHIARLSSACSMDSSQDCPPHARQIAKQRSKALIREPRTYLILHTVYHT